MRSDSVSLPTLFFSFNIALAVLGPLNLYIDFQFVNVHKITCCDFVWIALNLTDEVAKIRHFGNIDSSYPCT